MSFRSDRIQVYNNGVWGLNELCYGMPNVGDNVESINVNCVYLFNVIGTNLFAMMYHEDAGLATPPTINTVTRIRNLCRRARQLLASRMKADNEPRMEAQHATPAPEPFLIFPCPYWKVRSPHLKEYARYIFSCLSEIAQHTDTRRQFDIGENLAGIVGQYIHRVQTLVAVELLGQSPDVAKALDFDITDEMLNGYDPSQWFTSTEMVDTPPAPTSVPTEDDLKVLRNGIAAVHAQAFAVDYPTGAAPSQGVDGGATAATTQNVAATAFPSPPGP